MDWFERWNSPVYKHYLRLIEDFTTRAANLKLPVIDLKQDKIVMTDGSKVYRVTMPKYGDAKAVLKLETDPKKRAYIENYIRILDRKHDRDMQQHAKERKNMTYKDAVKHVLKHGPIQSASGAPIYYIEQLPILDEIDKAEKPKTPPPPRRKIRKNSREKIKENALNVVLSRSLGAVLPFKTREECKSRATKQKYYISKSDLVDLINKTPRLKDKVGEKAASMTKEQICDTIFAK